ncbi:MAG: preprotein translocase subunit YajC [Planctomycetes bacterium]|nr:preprotein translocase subunit YajC [Planctomycetota bacterium]
MNTNSSQNTTGAFASMLIPFVLMFVLLYVLIIRPQRKKEQERLKMLQNINKNDRVLTSGGIYGIVMNIKDNEVTLKIDETTNTKIRLARSSMIGIEKSGEPEPKVD